MKPATLQGIWHRATDAANRLHTLRAMASGRYGFALFGWVPVSRKPRVIELMNRLDDRILYTFEPAENIMNRGGFRSCWKIPPGSGPSSP